MMLLLLLDLRSPNHVHNRLNVCRNEMLLTSLSFLFGVASAAVGKDRGTGRVDGK